MKTQWLIPETNDEKRATSKLNDIAKRDCNCACAHIDRHRRRNLRQRLCESARRDISSDVMVGNSFRTGAR